MKVEGRTIEMNQSMKNLLVTHVCVGSRGVRRHAELCLGFLSHIQSVVI